MDTTELLYWARNTGPNLALTLLVLGVLLRLFEIFKLGRRPDFARRRPKSAGNGWKTVFTRTFAASGPLTESPLVYLSSYTFHICLLFISIFHIPLIGFLRILSPYIGTEYSPHVINAFTGVSLLALLILLLARITHKVRRFLSTTGDYLAWLLCFLPILTGLFTYNSLGLSADAALAYHLLSVELLLALLPFTPLFHAISWLIARWYTGDFYGRRGVPS